MTQGATQVNVFRLNHNSANFIAKLSRDKNITNADWLPFGLGLSIHQEKADKVDFFQLVEKPNTANYAFSQRYLMKSTQPNLQ